MQKHSLLKGTLILGIAGVIVKVIGAIYRIPLANIITSEGMGYYGSAYPIYGFLIAISTTGLPTAISKLVSEKTALGLPGEAHRVFRISFVTLFVVGLVSSTALFAGSKYLVGLLQNPKAYYSMIAVAPALFFVPLMSAFRGYFQGLQNMAPTALSQVFEQLGRVAVGFALAIVLVPRGLEYAAAGASFGASSGAVAGLIAIYIIYIIYRKRMLPDIQEAPANVREPVKSILYRLFAIAIPITLGTSVMPLMTLIDLSIVVRRLQFAGFSIDQSNSMYGQLSQMAATLINFPQVITVALAASLVPAISESVARRDSDGMRKKVVLGMKTGILVGLPASAGLFVLAKPIILMLYPREPETWMVLQVLALGFVFLAVIQTATGILQGVGKPIIPVKNLLVGSVFKLATSYFLTGIAAINIKGAALGTVIGYLVASLLNYIAVKREIGMAIGFVDSIVKPVVATLVMAVSAVAVYRGMFGMTGSNTLATLAAVTAGAALYGAVLVLIGGITASELELIPGGKRISAFLRKIGLFKK
ncbi:MAG: putative polysaccharide biosynthesis protein [Clostridia bacterium]|jgi:stage V sporulation protein B